MNMKVIKEKMILNQVLQKILETSYVMSGKHANLAGYALRLDEKKFKQVKGGVSELVSEAFDTTLPEQNGDSKLDELYKELNSNVGDFDSEYYYIFYTEDGVVNLFLLVNKVPTHGDVSDFSKWTVNDSCEFRDQLCLSLAVGLILLLL